MLKFNRRNKRLVIPVGINPSYNINVAELYNVNDADVVANDVLEGKIAYGKDGKIVGTLDVQSEKEESYQEGYEFGYDEGNNAGYRLGYDEGNEAGIAEQKTKLESITITENGNYNREDGWNSVVVEVPDLNGDYNEGYNAGMERGYTDGYNLGSEDGYTAGRNEIINEQSDADIISSDVIEGKIGYSKNNTKIIGSLDIQSVKDASYNQGYNIGYDAGEDAGIEIGKIEIINGMNDATITAGTVFKGEIGYGKDGERIVGDFEYVEGFDFGKIGYNTEESNEVNTVISDDLAYSKTFYDRWNNQSTPNFSTFFKNDIKIKYIPNVNLEKNINTLASSAFSGCSSIIYVPLLNTSKLTNMSNMFDSCSNITSVPLFDTGNVTDMNRMFYYCNKLTSVPLFDTGNVTDMSYMFYSCSNITTVPQFNTSNVITMNRMFERCSKLTSVPLFDTGNVTDMSFMFYSCSKLTSIPLFDIGNVSILQNTFGSCNLTEFPSLNTSNVTNIDGFIKGNSNLITIHSLNLQSVNTTGGLGTWNGFDGLRSLENVIALNNFGQSFSGTTNNGITLTSSSKLTRQSCLNIFNTIYDMNLNTSYTGTPTIQLSSTTKALLSSDDIAIATSKGWTIA